MKAVIKTAIGIVIAGSAMVASVAFAATISDARFSNNQTSIDATGNSTVSGTFTLMVGAGEVVEWFRYLPAGNPFTESSVGGTLGYQEGTHLNVPFSVKVPPNTGTYNIDVQGAGTWGGNRSIDGADNVVVGPTSVGMVRVVANAPSSSSTSTGGGVFGFSSFDDFMTAIKAALGIGATPTPVVKPACTTFTAKAAGAMQGVRNSQNIVLQGFLLSEGASIPALAAGASFGFWGPQTTSAVNWFKSVNGCN